MNVDIVIAILANLAHVDRVAIPSAFMGHEGTIAMLCQVDGLAFYDFMLSEWCHAHAA